MSQLYGCWLRPGVKFDALRVKVENSHSEYFPFFQRRVDAVSAIAELFVEEIVSKFPNLDGKVHVSYTGIISSIGRYINDIMHYKIWHDVKIANKAKMISHTIKWLALHPGVVTTANADDYASVSPDERKVLLELNVLFINSVIRYFLEFFCDANEPPPSKTYEKIFYLLETGQYDAKAAAVAFDGILP